MSILPGSRCGGCGADLSLYPTSAAAHTCFGPQAVHMTQVWCNRDHAAIEAEAAQAERERLLGELDARATAMLRNSGILQYGPQEFLEAIEDVRQGHTMVENERQP